MNVSPSHGTLQPGEGTVCKVTFVASGTPSFYDLDLICEVINMTDYNEYRGKLNAWEGEKERQKVEFCITEDNPDADNRLSAMEVGLPSSVRIYSIVGFCLKKWLHS